jgi:hypothetical protein
MTTSAPFVKGVAADGSVRVVEARREREQLPHGVGRGCRERGRSTQGGGVVDFPHRRLLTHPVPGYINNPRLKAYFPLFRWEGGRNGPEVMALALLLGKQVSRRRRVGPWRRVGRAERVLKGIGKGQEERVSDFAFGEVTNRATVTTRSGVTRAR